MKTLRICALLGFFSGLTRVIPLIKRFDSADASFILGVFSMREITYTFADLPIILYQIMPYLFFHFFFGTYIYKSFCDSSAYYFIRIQNRANWCTQRTLNLLVSALLYLIIEVSSGLLFSFFLIDLNWDLLAYRELLHYILIYSGFLFSTTVFINGLSITHNSTTGLLTVESISFCSILLFSSLELLSSDNGVLLEGYAWCGKINPFYHLVFGTFETISDYRFASILFVIFSIIAYIYLQHTIKQHEFLLINQEIGGI